MATKTLLEICSQKKLAIILIALLLLAIFNTYRLYSISLSIINCKLLQSEDFSQTAKNLYPVVVRPDGSIGNQLFQYSAAYSVARNRNSDLYICIEFFDHERAFSSNRKNLSLNDFIDFEIVGRSYALDLFQIPQDKLLVIPPGGSDCPLKHINDFDLVGYEIPAPYSEIDILANVVPENKIVLQFGHAMSEIFFQNYKDELLELFKLDLKYEMNSPPEKLLRQIENTESVSVHIKGRDYNAKSENDRNMTNTYYTEAFDLMIQKIKEKNNKNWFPKSNITFFVFSDDIEVVKMDFPILLKHVGYEIIYSSDENAHPIIDFDLMSKCKHNIVSSGSFGYWPAYFNQNQDKIVIAPLPKFPPQWYAKRNPDGVTSRAMMKIF